MKKTISAIAATASILGVLASGIQASANNEQTIDGRFDPPRATVPVEGIIGSFDNTTPGPNPDDLDHWINVTVPATALFYSTEASNHATITSPEYSIINHSAAGVVVTVNNVIDDDDMDEVATLNINAIPLFSNGNVVLQSSQLFTVPTNQRATFEFSGTTDLTDSNEEINPEFKLVLNFTAIPL